MRVVDQIIEYTREQGLLSADDLERLAEAGFVQRPAPAAERPVDGRWTARYWDGFTCEADPEEDAERDRATTEEPDETEPASRASKSARRGQAERRGRRWKGRRARRVRRALARARRQAGAIGEKATAA